MQVELHTDKSDKWHGFCSRCDNMFARIPGEENTTFNPYTSSVPGDQSRYLTMFRSEGSQPRRSIWDKVDQKQFEREIDALHCTKFIPQPRVLDKNHWPRAKSTDFLDFEVELHLVDDIAFVSACDYGAEYVTAATVDRSVPDVLTIRLAANEGVCSKVKDAWLRLIPLLEQCSAKCQ